MKNLTLSVVALMALIAVAPAQGKGSMNKMGVHACCVQGLSASEQKDAGMMMKSWTGAERDAWHHRCSLCMADPHKMLMKMEKEGKMPTDAMVREHMMSGLSKSQQMAMGKILADKKDSGLVMKMVENCCMYGAKHAK